MMRKKHLEVKVGLETLAVTVVGSKAHPIPQILVLHGAGFAQRKLSWPLVEELAQINTASVTFDYSGHGESSANTDRSLSKRVKEASEVFEKFKKSITTVIAFSMSGYVALHIAKKYHPETIILFAPAIYDTKAFEVPFGPEFSKVIRAENSWRNSDSKELLESFTGKLLIFIGENDEVIPREVVDAIYDGARSAKERTIRVLPNVGHRIAYAMQQDPQLCAYVSKEVVDFISHKTSSP